MKTPEEKIAANMKYRKTQKRIEVVFSLDQFDDVQAYADSKGMPIGTCLKDCLRRCMEMDAHAADKEESFVNETALAEPTDSNAELIGEVVKGVAETAVSETMKKLFKQFDIEVTIRER